MISPAISVLLPVYNADEYIKASIDSILVQTFADFELIIINDGSTDLSETIILSIQDERIKYSRNATNIGIVGTLNKAIGLASGKYIARMDADDISVKDRLEKQVAFLEKNPDIGLCGSQLRVLGENRLLEYPILNAAIKFDFLIYNAIAHPAVMFRKQLLIDSQLFYEPEYFPAEDYRLWVKLAAQSDFYNFPEPLLEYRLHHASVSHSQRKKQEEKVNEIRAYYLLESTNCWTDENERILNHMFLPGENRIHGDELLKIEHVLNNCFIHNQSYDKLKFKEYLKMCWYNACQKSDSGLIKLLLVYFKSNLFGGYKSILKLVWLRMKTGL